MAKTPPKPPDDEPEVREDPVADPELEAKPDPQAVTMAEDGAGEGDEVVWIRTLGSPELQRCYAKDAKGRQIRVGGEMFEHVGEGPDGAWLYEERAF